MINNLIGLGTILLGATMAKKSGVTFFESSSYSGFEVNSNVLNAVKSSEGIMETSYLLPNETRYTIGYGTVYLFDSNGKSFLINGSNVVQKGYTLSFLKSKMGYSTFSNEEFATELIKNHLKASRYSKVAKDLDSFNVSFKERFAEALMEVSYGSGSIFGYQSSDIYYTNFLIMARNAKTDLDFAKAYIYYRYNYYKFLTKPGQWATYRYGWMRRIVRLTLLVLGKVVSENELTNYVGSSGSDANRKKLANFVLTNFGIQIIW
ncbi:hypothetical protein CMU87_14245 [Elizabethkingia anophelis]|nr:hypothetical protein [Elizabethkingia anophelis]